MIREFRKMRSAKFDRLLPDFQPTDLRTVLLSAVPADVHPDKVMHARSQSIAAE